MSYYRLGLIVFIVGMCFHGLVYAEEALSFEQFISSALSKDSEFEHILLEELTLKYQKDLLLPAKDLLVSVKHQYEFYLREHRNSPDTSIGLTKAFPYLGTEVGVDYNVGASLSSEKKLSNLSFTIAQPIAQNAFGYSTRLLDKIVGIKVDVARHQIVEAYEDYLAIVMNAYYSWYEDYENLLVARSSYLENVKLLENMQKRYEQKIALPLDVHKVELQVFAKKEQLIESEKRYANSSAIVTTMIRANSQNVFIPKLSDPLPYVQGEFEQLYAQFTKESRTFRILQLLEEKSDLQVAKDANDLLPSINVIAGYEITGKEYNIDMSTNYVFGGVKIEWPLFDQVDRAEYNISHVTTTRQKLSTSNTYYRLYTQLMDLYLQIEREKKLLEIADERIIFAQAILKDEQENYSFGKITLNDYIQAFNSFDSNRFNKILQQVTYRKLIVEWLRLNDKLISKKEIEESRKG